MLTSEEFKQCVQDLHADINNPTSEWNELAAEFGRVHSDVMGHDHEMAAILLDIKSGMDRLTEYVKMRVG